MAAPAVRVELGFQTTSTLTGPNFLLDDPVKGLLDNVDWTLGGFVYVDVSEWLTGTISVNRGRSTEVDQYQAGTLSFTLRNEDRRFDPSNTDSPYYPGILPRSWVKAYLADKQIFGGYVDDFTVQYEMPNICTVSVSCVDAFTLLANTSLYSYYAPQAMTGSRITEVLDREVFPSSRNVAAGYTWLAAGYFDGATVLDHLQMVARSENGFLFVDRMGTLVFKDRYSLDDDTSQMTFADTGAADTVGYQAISQRSEATLLYNQVAGTRDAGAQQVANDAASQAQFLIRTLQMGSLGHNADSDVLLLCQDLLHKHSQPDVRFDSITVELAACESWDQAIAAGLDLTETVTVVRTPAGAGTPSELTKVSIIDGISFDLSATSCNYRMTLKLSTAYLRGTLFRVDDAVLGLLDTQTLKY